MVPKGIAGNNAGNVGTGANNLPMSFSMMAARDLSSSNAVRTREGEIDLSLEEFPALGSTGPTANIGDSNSNSASKGKPAMAASSSASFMNSAVAAVAAAAAAANAQHSGDRATANASVFGGLYGNLPPNPMVNAAFLQQAAAAASSGRMMGFDDSPNSAAAMAARLYSQQVQASPLPSQQTTGSPVPSSSAAGQLNFQQQSIPQELLQTLNNKNMAMFNTLNPNSLLNAAAKNSGLPGLIQSGAGKAVPSVAEVSPIGQRSAVNGSQLPATQSPIGQIPKVMYANATSASPIQQRADAVDLSELKKRLSMPEAKYGLLGLLNVIKMTDPDLNILSLGVNLIGLGFNLNASEPLYPTFSSLLGDHPSQGAEPQFSLPACYTFPSPSMPPLAKIASLADETLFYIFYAMPRDSLQEAAAQELFKRNWRYHKELKVWVTKEPGTEATSKTSTFERGVYLFFDPTTWTKLKKEWILQYDCLEDRIPATGRVAAGAVAANLEQQQLQNAQQLPEFDRPKKTQVVK